MTTSDDDASHEPWEALAIGYALMALTEGDEQAFRQHLATCRRCAETVAASTAVMGEMAYAAGSAEPPESLRAAIMRAAAAETVGAATVGAETPTAEEAVTADAPAETPSIVTPNAAAERRRRWRPPTWAAWTTAAACLALAIGALVGVAAQHSAHETDRAQLARLEPVLTCLRSPSCQTVHLTAPNGTGTTPATVLVQGEQALLLVDGLPRNDPATTIYVLWQKANGDVRAVHTFDVSQAGPTVIDVGQIDAPISATDFFAVSKEAGRIAPPEPSAPVALGVLHS